MSTPEMLQVKDLQVKYQGAGGTKFSALAGVSLAVREGETLGLVGESGCGKSTLGRTILGLEKPSAGSIHYQGRNLNGSTGLLGKSLMAEMQMVFQDPFGSLNPRRTIGQSIAEPLRNLGKMSAAQIAARVSEMLDLVGLSDDVAGRRPHEFSGGQRQRIGIARALAPSPRFIVADEPVSALDVSIQAQVINLLKDLTREGKLTMLMITHDLGVVRYIADRVAVMYLGQIVELAPRDELFAEPAHPYTQALLSAVPGGSGRERIVLSGELPNPADPPPGCRFNTRCAFATTKCRTEVPELQQIDADRLVRCHYPLVAGTAALRIHQGAVT